MFSSVGHITEMLEKAVHTTPDENKAAMGKDNSADRRHKYSLAISQ